MTEIVPMWDFEAAEPDVGFLTDSITHLCEANVEADTFDVKAAVIADVTCSKVTVTHPSGKTEEMISETTLWLCPACKATTANTEHWPLWFYQGEFI